MKKKTYTKEFILSLEKSNIQHIPCNCSKIYFNSPSTFFKYQRQLDHEINILCLNKILNGNEKEKKLAKTIIEKREINFLENFNDSRCLLGIIHCYFKNLSSIEITEKNYFLAVLRHLYSKLRKENSRILQRALWIWHHINESSCLRMNFNRFFNGIERITNEVISQNMRNCFKEFVNYFFPKSNYIGFKSFLFFNSLFMSDKDFKDFRKALQRFFQIMTRNGELLFRPINELNFLKKFFNANIQDEKKIFYVVECSLKLKVFLINKQGIIRIVDINSIDEIPIQNYEPLRII
jgi:hypothetical protein